VLTRPLEAHPRSDGKGEQRSFATFEVSYRDGEGILRRVLAAATQEDCAVSNLEAAHKDPATVTVTFNAEGRYEPGLLLDSIHGVDGVTEVRMTDTAV
jgi:ACT domain-containing protein